MMKKIYLSAPDLTGNEFQYVKEAFDTNWIAPVGPNLNRFEEVVCGITGKNNGVALSSGTAAIHMALKYVGVGAGDEVFCSDLTFAGSCNPIYYEGAEAVFIDSEPESWNMSPIALKRALEDSNKAGKLPRAVIIVNLYGQSADMDALLPLCEQYGVPVIEDAAESLGALYKGKRSGFFGRYSVVSFNGNKIVTTSSGGMLLSDSKDAIDKCRFWATQSRENAIHYEHKEIGYNYRMSNVLAGIGLGQCEQLDMKIAKKKRIFDTYQEAFSDIPEIVMMPIPQWSRPNYWLSVLTLRSEALVKPHVLIQTLADANIESRPLWKPMHMQPVFMHCRFYSHREITVPPNESNTIPIGRSSVLEGVESVSEDLFNRGSCLPSGTGMTEAEQERVIVAVRKLMIAGGERS